MRLGYSAIAVMMLGGCFADGHVGVRAAVVVPQPVVAVDVAPPPPVDTSVYVDGNPDLVEVQPGVQVVYDADEPIFFTDGFYWRQNNGVWFSSRTYGGGWGRYDGVPMRFRGNFNVHAYSHYHPAGFVPSHRVGGGGVRVEGRGEVRDNVRVEGRTEGGVHDNVRVEGRTEGAGHDNVRVEGRTEAPHDNVRVEGRTEAHPATVRTTTTTTKTTVVKKKTK
jgi:hypothetical protein